MAWPKTGSKPKQAKNGQVASARKAQNTHETEVILLFKNFRIFVQNFSVQFFSRLLHYLGRQVGKNWYLPFRVFSIGDFTNIFGRYIIKKHTSIQEGTTKTRKVLGFGEMREASGKFCSLRFRKLLAYAKRLPFLNIFLSHNAEKYRRENL